MIDEYRQARPSAALRGLAGWYSGYRQRGVAPARHRGLPSPYLTLIFTLDDPLIVAAHPDPSQRPGSYDALIGGLHLTPALITHPGRQSGVQVALSPLGCRALFGLPAAELAGADLDASAVLGPALVDEVRDRLRSSPDWPSRFAALDAVLLRLVRADRPAASAEVRHACHRLFTGNTAIATVAGEIGWSPRHLTDRFRAETGLRPKEAARVARFDRARRALHPGVRLADLAANHGYADQSHLTREFHAFAGCSPTRWLSDEAGEFVFVQDPSGAERAGSGHER